MRRLRLGLLRYKGQQGKGTFGAWIPRVAPPHKRPHLDHCGGVDGGTGGGCPAEDDDDGGGGVVEGESPTDELWEEGVKGSRVSELVRKRGRQEGGREAGGRE